MRNNIFTYATSELSQDAFLCWLFSHFKSSKSPYLSDLVINFLKLLIEKDNELSEGPLFTPDLDAYNLEIYKQYKNIDILLHFSGTKERIKPFSTLIEDKVNASESRENQIETYKKELESIEKFSKTQIIPVYLKTGYCPQYESESLQIRKINVVNHNDIFNLFHPFQNEFSQSEILYSWWNYFLYNFHEPINDALSLKIAEAKNLSDNRKNFSNFSNEIYFEKLCEFLFQNLRTNFGYELYPFQGSGHIDWHFGLYQKNWGTEKRNLSIGIYFIWNEQTYDFKVKAHTFDLHKKRDLSEETLAQFSEEKQKLKESISESLPDNWKITNYFLQICTLKNINSLSVNEIKAKIEIDIPIIASQIDKALSK